MKSDILSVDLRTRHIGGLVSNIQTYFEREEGVRYPDDVIRSTVDIWLEDRFDRILEEMGEVITSPHMAESQNFRRILREQMSGAESPAVAETEIAADPVGESTVFNGYRDFSPARLGAMIGHIARSGLDIYKTNLNKLLFYSDLTHYFQHGAGISGATYVNMPFGPVPERVESVINDLAAAGDIERRPIPGMGAGAQMIMPGFTSEPPMLSPDEIKTIDWVLEQYGAMSATEISSLSHREKAYSNTRPGEPIAYEYAKFFRRLPGR